MDERTRPQRIRLTGLQEAQLAALRGVDQACAEMYYAKGFDGAEVPTRTTAEIAQLARRHSVRVVEADHVAAGYLAWRDESPGVAYIEELSVHPDFQRFGLGGRLLDALRDEARGLGLAQVTVRCWERATWAMAFYRRHGFVPIDGAAPEKVQHWRDERSETHPLTRPGEVALWAPIGAAAAVDETDNGDGEMTGEELDE